MRRRKREELLPAWKAPGDVGVFYVSVALDIKVEGRWMIHGVQRAEHLPDAVRALFDSDIRIQQVSVATDESGRLFTRMAEETAEQYADTFTKRKSWGEMKES